ncbi:MAG: presqualene diphosphate synthase HpnD [Verrucomicrobia subdivision 3 bacterium]|nr:presqualene diphosphate synthase HpnD [Limisphaerales bacterium]
MTTATANNPAALEASRAITRRSASNLALSFVALDKRRRNAMSALYAFCRQVDDVADDETQPREQRAATLQDWREDIRRACEGGQPRTQVNQALQPVIEQYALKFEYFDELIRGMEMDLAQDRFETREELDCYCYRAASVVGLLSIEIFGYRNDACQQYAVHLGKALQLTNILRDVGNDAARGRIYLPVSDMEKYGVDPQSLLDLKYSAAFHNLAAATAVRARSHYQMASELLPAADRRAMVAAEAMGAVYWRLLRRMENNKFRVFGPRPTRLGRVHKLALVFGTWWRIKTGSNRPNYGCG